MFERFNDSFRLCVVAAQEEARMRGNRQIETAHLLLGLRHVPKDVGPEVLASMGASLDAVCERATAGLKVRRRKPKGHLPMTDEVKEAIEGSLAVSVEFGREDIGTEHLLCALLAQPRSDALRALREAGVEHDAYADRVRAWYRRIEVSEAPARPVPPSRPSAP